MSGPSSRLSLPLYLALRYLRSARRDAFVTFLSATAAGGMALGVAALVLVASFVTAPFRIPRFLVRLLFPLLLLLPLPAFLLRRFLLGRGAPYELVRELVKVVRSVRPRVIIRRILLKDPPPLEQLQAEIEARDERDKTRSVAPLVQVEDAHYLDTSELSFEEVVERLAGLVQEKTG